MPGAFEPGRDGAFSVTLPGRDVLPGYLPNVTRTRNALAGRAAVGAVVARRAALGHVERVHGCRRASAVAIASGGASSNRSGPHCLACARAAFTSSSTRPATAAGSCSAVNGISVRAPHHDPGVVTALVHTDLGELRVVDVVASVGFERAADSRVAARAANVERRRARDGITHARESVPAASHHSRARALQHRAHCRAARVRPPPARVRNLRRAAH